jgi:hypothetical protein
VSDVHYRKLSTVALEKSVSRSSTSHSRMLAGLV